MSTERHRKTALPIERVFGGMSRPSLRLVTCGGPFDAGPRSYRDNVVV